MTTGAGVSAPPRPETARGERTRSAILDASRMLFLERGYAGTAINAITEACGISRAGFYTYFKDKREIFNELGENAYHDVLAVIGQWPDGNLQLTPTVVEVWVGHYFDYMDRHGAFVLASAQSAPDDAAFRQSRNLMVSRASWKLGLAIAGEASHSPDVVGVAVMGLLDQAWHTVNRQTVAVERREMVAVVAAMIVALSRRSPSNC